MLTGPALPAERPRRLPIVLPRAPNVILVVAEGLGFGHLGCYGQKLIKTPNLDRMAAEGVRFADYYAGGATCRESRYCLLTGRRAPRASTNDIHTPHLKAKDWTMASMLKQAGYSTAVFGTWLIGSKDSGTAPTQKGFDEWFGFLDPSHALEAYPKFLWRNDIKVGIPKNESGAKAVYANDFFIQAALNFVRLNAKKPFFLLLSFSNPDPETGLASNAPYGGEKWPAKNKSTAAMITRMDSNVGALLAQLKELRIDQHTAVFFISDHGPLDVEKNQADLFQSTGSFRWDGGDLSEGNIRVPLIAHWPGRFQTNRVSSNPAAVWDLVPTVVEIANMSAPPEGLGASLLPDLRGEKVRDRGPLLWQLQNGTNLVHAVRSGPWKGVRRGGLAPIELYDLRSDPGERHNVAETNPERAAQLEELIKRGTK